MVNIGAKIKHFRDLKGYSQEDMAAKLGVSLKTYSNWETEKTNIGADKIQKIAEVLGMYWLEMMCFGEKILQIGDINCNGSGHTVIYATDKDVIHALENSRQECVYLKKNVEDLEKRVEDLQKIIALLEKNHQT